MRHARRFARLRTKAPLRGRSKSPTRRRRAAGATGEADASEARANLLTLTRRAMLFDAQRQVLLNDLARLDDGVLERIVESQRE